MFIFLIIVFFANIKTKFNIKQKRCKKSKINFFFKNIDLKKMKKLNFIKKF